MMMGRDNAKKELRRLKNRESAERNRREKDDTIEALEGKILNLSTQIHTVEIENWSLRRSFDTGAFLEEPFPDVQFLTKEEIRRKKNRESAERSRLRKLARIDDLTFTACEMFVHLRDLTEMNCALRSAPRSIYHRPRAHATAVSYGFDDIDDDCVSNHGQDWGDFLATIDLNHFEFV
ncbi:hypothetical protein B484DRAFT_416808 [Ochromonadaceae sp. CCMP2298]|nr:hypothetical protein B484DRAFT_416808 [Ochromonadaceae sp. CCMP2298]